MKEKAFRIKKAELLFGDRHFLIRPLERGDFNCWRETLASLPGAKNEWDESAWKEKFLTKTEFKKILKAQADDIKADRNYRFLVFEKTTRAWIGSVSVMDISRGIFQNGYLGYLIFSPYWGNAFAPRIVNLAVQWSFAKLKLHRVEAAVSPRNKRSIRVLEKTQFRLEGLSRKRLLHNGTWEDMLVFAKTYAKTHAKTSAKTPAKTAAKINP